MAVLAQWCISVEYRDAKGQTRKITVCWQADGGTAAINAAGFASAVEGLIPAMQACSNAHVQSEQNFQGGGTGQSGVTYGSAAEYISVSQQARLYYLTVDPSGDPSPTAVITIPAPISAIFEADGVTVNPAASQIVALNTALSVGGATSAGPVACTKSGLLLSSFVGGIFVGKKLSRKWTRYTKDPTLTIAGI